MQKPSTCRPCSLYKSGRGFARLNPTDKLIHITRLLWQDETLGNEEADEGRAFVGGAGKLSRHIILPNAGLSAEQVAFDNVLRCMPPKRGNEAYPIGDERKQAERCCRQYDVWDSFPGTPLICVGGKAGNMYIGSEKISEYHGHIEFIRRLDLPEGYKKRFGGRMIGFTYHPAAVMRQYNLLPVVIKEVANLMTASQNPDLLIRPKVIKYLQKPEDNHAALAFDLEWSSSITVVGYADNPGCAHSSFDVDRGLQIIREHQGRLVGHNILGSGADFAHLGWWPQQYTPDKVFDTKIAAHLIHAHLAALGLFDLGSLVRFYRPTSDWKRDKADVLTYNGLDCAYTYRLYEDLVGDLTLTKQWHLMEKQQKLARLAVLMQEQGLDINVEGVRHAVAEKKAVNERIKKALPINPNSPAQVVKWADGLGIDIGDVRYETIVRYRGRNADFDQLINYREDAKSLKTWFSYDQDKEDNVTDVAPRIYPSWNPTGTDVARFSCAGPNCQNIPPQLRHLIVASLGMEIVSFDASQIENRCVAWLAHDEQMLTDFALGLDIHRLVASRMFSKRYEDVTVDERFEGKTTVHAGDYGETVTHLSIRLYGNKKADSLRRAQRLMDAYFSVYHRTRDWQNEISAYLETGNTMLRNPYGRVRFIYAQNKHERMKRGCHFLGCSTAAEIVNERALAAWDELGAVPSLIVHDELAYVRPVGDVKFRKSMQELLLQPVPQMDGMVFPWKAKVGVNYGELKEIEGL